MSREKLSSALSWYAIYTNPRQEDRAYENLAAWKVEAFVPKIKEYRHNLYTGKPTYIVKPLFARYIFARFCASQLFHMIRFTRGVHSIVSFGDSPTPVDDRIVDAIKARVDKEGYVSIGEELRFGDEVMIRDGPLRDFAGIFERHIKDGDRVMILLETVSYQAHIAIDRQAIERLAS